MRRKKRKRLARQAQPVLAPTTAPNERWNMDFMEDSLASGRKFRMLNVLDEHCRECLAIEVDSGLSAQRVTRVLEGLAAERGAPREITVDNGPEYTSRALEQWAQDHTVALHFSRPGKPTDNPFVESFNGKFRDECLNENWFTSVPDARRIIAAYRREYNEERPHSSLGYRTPREFAALCSLPLPPPARCGPQLGRNPSTRRNSHNLWTEERGQVTDPRGSPSARRGDWHSTNAARSISDAARRVTRRRSTTIQRMRSSRAKSSSAEMVSPRSASAIASRSSVSSSTGVNLSFGLSCEDYHRLTIR